MRRFRFNFALPRTPTPTLGDGVIVLGIAAVLYAGMRSTTTKHAKYWLMLSSGSTLVLATCLNSLTAGREVSTSLLGINSIMEF